MSEPRPPISTERARVMLAKVQVKLRRPHLPDGDREKLLVAEKLLQAKLRAHANHPERAERVHDWRTALYHLRRSLGLPHEYPDAATLTLAKAQAEAASVDGERGGDQLEGDGA